MSLIISRFRILFDNFTFIFIGVVLLATFLFAHGQGVVFFERLTIAVIALLFFLHGVKLSRCAIIDGVLHWRLHLLIFACTFILFFLLMLSLQPLLKPLLKKQL